MDLVADNGELVYHYTSMDTLFKIIENRSFWLVNLRSSMDYNELAYAENKIKTLTNKKYNHEFKYFEPEFTYYALSCTSLRDSYFHFNNYGDNCHGVAIGINRNFLEDITNEDVAKLLKRNLDFKEVIYNEQKQETLINELLEYNIFHCNDLKINFDSCLSIIKSKEFELEKEIRLTLTQNYMGVTILSFPFNGKRLNFKNFFNSLNLDNDIKFQQNLKFACINKQIRKYYELNFKDYDINKIIKEIVIAPKSKQNIEELETYFIHNDIKAKICKSNIELRN